MEAKNTLVNKRHFIEENRKNSVINDVLDSKTTIRNEVENFYDIGFSYALRGTDYTKKPNPEKSGKIPTGLLEIINPFSEQGTLNSKFLDYESVRGQIKEIGKNDNRFLLRSLVSIMGIMGVVSGAAIIPSDYSTRIIGVSAAVGIAGILSLIKLVKDGNKEGETLEYKEFSRLKDSVRSADGFIRKYKIYEELK